MNQKHYYVYIVTNKNNTVLYTGVTSRIAERIWEHKDKKDMKSFTAQYRLSKLVYLEDYSDIREAIAREKQIKKGSRNKKVEMVNNVNPKWKDLSEDL